MKNTILTSIMTLLLLSGIAFAGAPGYPLLIGGNVYGYPNHEVKITNVNTGVSALTTNYGPTQWAIEWSNVEAWRDADKLKIEVTFCSTNPICIKEYTAWEINQIMGSGNSIDFDLSSLYTPPKKCVINEQLNYDNKQFISYQDEQCEVYINAPEKPICPVPPTDVNYDWEYALGGGLLALLLSFLVGKYVPYKGKIKIETGDILSGPNKGKQYERVYRYEKYTRADGTIAGKFVKVSDKVI